MSASNDMRLHALGIMKTRFGRRWNTDYANLFDRAFDSLTDEQVRVALDYMLDSYQYHDPMSPAEFKGWGGVREQDARKRAHQPFIYTSPATGILQPSVMLLAEDDPYAAVEPQVPNAEGKERLKAILAMMDGNIGNPLTQFERNVLVCAPDSRHPDIVAMRDKQRAALGWHPLK